MKFDKNKQLTIFLVLTLAWYLISFLIPYNTLANSLGIVNLGRGHSWPLSFFLMDALVIILTAVFVVVFIQAVKKKQFQWILVGILLIYPLITVWATLQDLVFSPIAPATTNDSPVIIASPTNMVISPTPDTSALKAGGNSYLDTKGVYTVLYPNDYKLDVQNGGTHTRIYKTGATQKGQTEIYDGVLVVFESVDLGGKSLSEWVDARIKESTADGTSEIIQPKKATTLNTYPGFTYEVRGLGTSTYIVAQKNAQSDYAVNITYLVADPEKVGYQTEVDSILSTLELLK